MWQLAMAILTITIETLGNFYIISPLRTFPAGSFMLKMTLERKKNGEQCNVTPVAICAKARSTKKKIHFRFLNVAIATLLLLFVSVNIAALVIPPFVIFLHTMGTI